jgi:hypothetical protein
LNLQIECRIYRSRGTTVHACVPGLSLPSCYIMIVVSLPHSVTVGIKLHNANKVSACIHLTYIDSILIHKQGEALVSDNERNRKPAKEGGKGPRSTHSTPLPKTIGGRNSLSAHFLSWSWMFRESGETYGSLLQIMF